MGATVKLYELADAARILDEFLVEAEGELTPEIESLLDSLELDIKAKVQDVALYIQQLVATAAAVRLEEDRLSRRRKAAERTAEALRGYLLRNMMRLDLKKVEGSRVTVALQ